MHIHIAPLTEDLVHAARAFNARLGPHAPFYLPDTVSSSQCSGNHTSPAISWTHYVAMDGSEARGGFLLMDQPAWINGQACRVSNCQSVLSEGIRNRRYGPVAVHLLKYIEKHARCNFLVGMGNVHNPLPRLLKGSGWTLRHVPFFFRVQNVENFLQEMRVFRRNKYRRLVARAALISGAGWAGTRLLQWRPWHLATNPSGLKVEYLTNWGSWADEIWQQYKTQCSFAVARDRSTLELLYPMATGKFTILLLTKNLLPIGWATWLNKAMSDDSYFGNLRVVTVLDCLAVPKFAQLFARLLSIELERSGADLAITNQSHFLWTNAFRKAGFLSVKSNYLLATSKSLNAEILAGGGEERIHLTRGDGDGRIHL